MDDFFYRKFSGQKIYHPRTAESAEYTEYLVSADWSNADYLAKRWAWAKKTSSRNAHTLTRELT